MRAGYGRGRRVAGSGRRIVAWLLTGAVIAGGVASPAVPARASSLVDQIHDAQNQLQDILNQIKATKSKLSRNRTQAKQLNQQLNDLDQKLAQTEQRLAELQSQVGATQTLLDQTTAKLKAEEAELARRESLVSDRLVAMYKAGSLSYLEVLLSSKSFSDFVERFTLLHRIATNDARLMYATQEQRDAVAARKAQVTAQRDQLVALQAQVESTKSTLNQQITAKQQLKSQLDKDAKAYEQQLDEMEASSARVQSLLEHLQSEYNRQQGKFVMVYPLAGGKRYRISDPFGMRFHPILHTYRMHTGVDLAAPYGTTIVAAAPGRVVYAGWMSGYGNTTVIDHGKVDGHAIATLYGHQSAIYVKVGQIVSAGQRIGAVGSTGLSTGTHLHFEVRRDGVPVNPESYVNLH